MDLDELKWENRLDLFSHPEGYEPGPGDVAIVPDDPEKSYPAQCQVTVL